MELSQSYKLLQFADIYFSKGNIFQNYFSPYLVKIIQFFYLGQTLGLNQIYHSHWTVL